MTDMDEVRVLIADDQRVVREGLQTLLSLLPGIAVVGAAENGAQALDLTAELDPDIVLMDLRMPVLSGVEATEQLLARGARAGVVVLTTYSDDDWVFAALRAGARGFLTKDASAEEIRQAVLTVHAGEAQLEPSVQRRLLAALTERSTIAPVSGSNPDALTPRELVVLDLIARGRSNGEIAQELFVADATVKTHINHLLAKTGSRDRAQLVGYAYRIGVIQP